MGQWDGILLKGVNPLINFTIDRLKVDLAVGERGNFKERTLRGKKNCN